MTLPATKKNDAPGNEGLTPRQRAFVAAYVAADGDSIKAIKAIGTRAKTTKSLRNCASDMIRQCCEHGSFQSLLATALHPVDAAYVVGSIAKNKDERGSDRLKAVELWARSQGLLETPDFLAMQVFKVEGLSDKAEGVIDLEPAERQDVADTQNDNVR